MVNFSKKKILITGGAGFIGKHLIQRLQQQDVRSIRVTSRNLESDSFLNNLGLDIKVGDLKDPIFCDQITEGIDVVFHLAGQKHNYFVFRSLGKTRDNRSEMVPFPDALESAAIFPSLTTSTATWLSGAWTVGYTAQTATE